MKEADNMESEIRKERSGNYLILHGEGNDSYRMKMLRHNRIEGLLPVERRGINDSIEFCYEISGYGSLPDKVKAHLLSEADTAEFLLAVSKVLKSGEKYLLEENDFVLLPELIYLKQDTWNVGLCYLEGYGKDMELQMLTLLEFIMNHVNYDDDHAVSLSYVLYQACKEGGLKAYEEKLADNTKEMPEEQGVERKSGPELKTDAVISIEPESDRNQENIQNPVHREEKKKTRNQVNREKKKVPPPGIKDHQAAVAEKREEHFNLMDILLPVSIAFAASGIIYSGILPDSVTSRTGKLPLIAAVIVLVAAGCEVIRYMQHRKKNEPAFLPEEDDQEEQEILAEESARFGKIRFDEIRQKKENEDSGNEETSASPALRENTDASVILPAGEEQRILSFRKITFPEEPEPVVEEKTKVLFQKDRETKCLYQEEHAAYYLESINRENQEKVPVNKTPFLVGSRKNKVDLCIASQTVSRIHARLELLEGRLYITDEDSLNGTYLQGERLLSGQRREVKKGDELRFAEKVMYVS